MVLMFALLMQNKSLRSYQKQPFSGVDHSRFSIHLFPLSDLLPTEDQCTEFNLRPMVVFFKRLILVGRLDDFHMVCSFLKIEQRQSSMKHLRALVYKWNGEPKSKTCHHVKSMLMCTFLMVSIHDFPGLLVPMAHTRLYVNASA